MRERLCFYGEIGRGDRAIGWQNQEANDILSAKYSVQCYEPAMPTSMQQIPTNPHIEIVHKIKLKFIYQ
jgi:hypothetical protein